MNNWKNWKSKTLEDWKDWKIRIIWKEDPEKIEEEIDKWLQVDIVKKIIDCWKKVKARYVSWLEYEL